LSAVGARGAAPAGDLEHSAAGEEEAEKRPAPGRGNPVVLASCLPEDEDDLLGITPSTNAASSSSGAAVAVAAGGQQQSPLGSSRSQQHLMGYGQHQHQQQGMMGPPPPPPPKGRRASEASGQHSSQMALELSRAGRSMSSPGDPLHSPPAPRRGKALGLPAGNSSTNSLGDPHMGLRSPVGVLPSGWPASGARGGPGGASHMGHMHSQHHMGGRPGVMSPPLVSPAAGPMHGAMGAHTGMLSPQAVHGCMHGYGPHSGGGMGSNGQQLMPTMKPQPSKRLEIVDPRRKSAEAAVCGSSGSGCSAAAAGGKAGGGSQQRRGSEGGAVLSRRGSGGAKGNGSDAADGAAVLTL
jgi:hypothetical protein